MLTCRKFDKVQIYLFGLSYRDANDSVSKDGLKSCVFVTLKGINQFCIELLNLIPAFFLILPVPSLNT